MELVVCVTHHPGHVIIFVGCGDCPEFLLEEIEIWPACRFYFTGGLSACTGSIEGGFISSPNAFKHSFAAITVSLTHPDMYFALVCLVCSGACLSKGWTR